MTNSKRSAGWWVTAVLVFGCGFALFVDIFLFLLDSETTISAHIERYLGGSKESYRAAIFGFLVGSLFTHFTRWGK